MRKSLERLLNRFLREENLVRYARQEFQRAYQADNSAETALHSLVTKIEGNMWEKQYALVAFMDIQEAFNLTTFAAIQEALERRNVVKQ